MLTLIALLGPHLALAALPAPSCRAAQLKLSVDEHNGDYNGMSHAGTEVSLRNIGRDCMLSTLPLLQFRDKRGHLLLAKRATSRTLHPGPHVGRIRLSGGHRAAAVIRWVSGPVYPHNRSIMPSSVVVRLGTSRLSVPFSGVIYGLAGRPIRFDQAPLELVEGMAAG